MALELLLDSPGRVVLELLLVDWFRRVVFALLLHSSRAVVVAFLFHLDLFGRLVAGLLLDVPLGNSHFCLVHDLWLLLVCASHDRRVCGHTPAVYGEMIIVSDDCPLQREDREREGGTQLTLHDIHVSSGLSKPFESPPAIPGHRQQTTAHTHPFR